MSKSQEVWEKYKNLLESGRYDEWSALWANDSRFIVVYGKERFGEETYSGRENIVSFFSGAHEKIRNYFENDVVHETKNPDVFFVTFDFNAIIITSNYHYKNRIACQFTLDKEGKIKELIEYADPTKRQAFLNELGGEDGAHVNLEKSADILQGTFKHYYDMAMDHHTKAATVSSILLIIVGAIIGLVGLDKQIGGVVDFVSGFAVTVVGVFGAAWAWKQHERYHYWEHLAYQYQEALTKIVPMLKPAKDYSDGAREAAAKDFGDLFAKRIEDRYLWVSLHVIVVVMGLALMAVSLLVMVVSLLDIS